jgi:hypothetical protein
MDPKLTSREYPWPLPEPVPRRLIRLPRQVKHARRLLELPTFNPFALIRMWSNWYEQRGVYVPGEDSSALSPWRDFGWFIAIWLIIVAMFVLLFVLIA